MKTSTIRLLEVVAESALQVRRSNHCSREQIYEAMDALHWMYNVSDYGVFSPY